MENGVVEAAASPRRAARTYPGVRALVVDGTRYHRAGASDAEELGCSLAAGVAYLRALTAAGLVRRRGLWASWRSLRGDGRPVL